MTTKKKTAAPRIVFKKMNAVEYATKAHAHRAATLQSFAIWHAVDRHVDRIAILALVI